MNVDTFQRNWSTFFVFIGIIYYIKLLYGFMSLDTENNQNPDEEKEVVSTLNPTSPSKAMDHLPESLK